MKTFGLLAFAAIASAKVYFKETFDAGWEDRWVQSKAKDDFGVFKASHGKWYGDAEIDTGLQTSQDARFYSIAAPVDPAFSNEGEDLVVQFSVKHEQKIDCGGGYLKLLKSGEDLENFHGETEYNIMFGPDICGAGTKKVHVILNYKGENHLIKTKITPETDELTHVYTLHLKPDQTFTVYIDQEEKASGSIEEDWDILPPKLVKDPDASKPEDWDDRLKIPDPDDTKPDGWDDIPEFIEDPEAEKPEDWDDEMDGDWEAPTIPNPEYRGEWTPRLIDNPAYQGKWVHPEIDNPDYEYDPKIYAFPSFGAVGIDIWQVKSGSIFDNIIMTNDLSEAQAFYQETTGKTIDGEKAMKAKADEEARKKAEEEAAAAAAEAEDFGDYDDLYYGEEDEDDHAHDDL